MKIEKLPINTIKPYWRNPRKNEKAVQAVKESIERYGYNQPIVVDSSLVIIVGHTRYRALRELGYTEVDVVIADLDKDKAKAYRIADNKTHELSSWDADLLTFELRELLGAEDMAPFFDDKELDSLLDINSYSQQAEDKLTKSIRAEVVASIPDAVQDAEMEAEVQRRVDAALRSTLQDELNEKQKEMNERFAESSQATQEDYLYVTCPHCNTELTLAKSALIRNQKHRD